MLNPVTYDQYMMWMRRLYAETLARRQREEERRRLFDRIARRRLPIPPRRR